MDTSHLPPDGTYPSRILAPSASIWLKDGETLDVSGKSIIFRRAGKDFYVAPHPKAKHEPMLNGTPMIVERLLKDGDFVHCGKERYIFQADPVADWRKSLQEEPELLESYEPTEWLQKWVIFRKDGVSIDGGETFIKWEEIVSAAFDKRFAKPACLIFRLQSQISKTLILKQSEVEKRQFGDGLTRYCPFSLSGSMSAYITFDAYLLDVGDHFLSPSELHKRPLPAKIEFMEAEDIRKHREKILMLRVFTVLLIFLPLVGAIGDTITGKYQDFFTALRYYIIFVVLFFLIHIGLHLLVDKLPSFIFGLFRKPS
jgi:hypothetical protein